MPQVDVREFYESLPTDGSGRDCLSEVERKVAAICDLRQEVNSGGFDSYLRYWGGDTAPEALAVIGTALGPAWLDILRQAMLALGPEYPEGANDRFDRIDEPGVGAQLNDLDTLYFDLENSSDADGLLTAYLARS